MVDHKGRILQSIGAGMMVTAIVAALNPSAAWTSLVWCFAGVMGLSLFSTMIATVPADVWAHYKLRLHEQEERQFTLQQKRAALFQATSPAAPTMPAYSARQEKWRRWFIARIEDAKRVGGPKFRDGMGQVMSFDVWKNIFTKHLLALKIIYPVSGGTRTDWAQGITPEAAIAVIRAAQPLPCPDDFDPPPETPNGVEHEKRRENAGMAL